MIFEVSNGPAAKAAGLFSEESHPKPKNLHLILRQTTSLLRKSVISEEILLQRMKVGDGAAFEELTRRYETRVYNFHCWFTGDMSLAEDLTQETFTAIWRGLGGFKGEAKLSTWIHRIARNVALQNARKGKVETVPLEQISEKTATDCTADAAERGLIREAVGAALAELPQEQREALVLNKLNGLSHSEVAQILNRPLGTIKWQIAQALQSLRSSLQRRGMTDGKM
jgi:RNA polymerase sigma-70 factor, ECF subfamily